MRKLNIYGTDKNGVTRLPETGVHDIDVILSTISNGLTHLYAHALNGNNQDSIDTAVATIKMAGIELDELNKGSTAVKLFKSHSFYNEWVHEYEIQHKEGLPPNAFLREINPEHFIYSGLTFSETLEGYYYWMNIHNEWTESLEVLDA